jgi:hypothetical protein
MALQEEDTPQVKALRAMQQVLKDKDWEKLYTDHSYPHLREQLDLDNFKAFMTGPKGQPVVEVFDDVLKAVDSKADKTVLLAQPQEKEEPAAGGTQGAAVAPGAWTGRWPLEAPGYGLA